MSAVAAIAPARKAAFDILLAVERSKSHSDELLRGKGIDALSAADRNLATALVLGALRWQIRLDYEFRPLLARPNAKLDAEVFTALRLGVFQILFLDRIPAHAAIDDSVELVKKAGHRFASGMVNAVLRRMAGGERKPLLEASPAEVATALAHPAWMVERWASLYGLDAARAICRYGQEQPATTIRVEDLETEAELKREGVRLRPAALLAAARVVEVGDLAATTAFQSGRVRIQDEGSQLVAELAAASGGDSGARSILDACAAPGGKTLILAARNPEARIVACEASSKRYEQLRERLANLASNVECRLADATALGEDEAFDVALVDAPCSGTGTLGRNPEIRHRLQVDDLRRQAERQRGLLAAALSAVRASGRVIYSTCSLEPEENDEVVAAVLAKYPGTRQVSLGPEINLIERRGVVTARGAEQLRGCLTAEGALTLLPGAVKTDGFYVALIEKRYDSSGPKCSAAKSRPSRSQSASTTRL